jgi:hypothetical protein
MFTFSTPALDWVWNNRSLNKLSTLLSSRKSIIRFGLSNMMITTHTPSKMPYTATGRPRTFILEWLATSFQRAATRCFKNEDRSPSLSTLLGFSRHYIKFHFPFLPFFFPFSLNLSFSLSLSLNQTCSFSFYPTGKSTDNQTTNDGLANQAHIDHHPWPLSNPFPIATILTGITENRHGLLSKIMYPFPVLNPQNPRRRMPSTKCYDLFTCPPSHSPFIPISLFIPIYHPMLIIPFMSHSPSIYTHPFFHMFCMTITVIPINNIQPIHLFDPIV